VIKRVYDWSEANFVAGYGVDITWQRIDGTFRGSTIDADSLGNVVNIINRTSDRTESTVEVPGVLIGIDSKSKRFRFVEHDGPDYLGSFSPVFPSNREWSINRNYRATIRVEEVTRYATMETEKTYRLVKLSDSA
jgi:hypothetical protein